MTEQTTLEMKPEASIGVIGFAPLRLDDRALYERFFPDEHARGCEFTFANLHMWGVPSMAVLDRQMVLFSEYGKLKFYLYPIGMGDKRAAIDAILADAAARGIPCRISGLDTRAKETLDALYPGKFRYHRDIGSFDYVYDIDDLAELKGKKYHGKRNHFYRFAEAHPDYTVEPIGEENLSRVKDMVEAWYAAKLEADPEANFRMEKIAIEKAFLNYEAFGMDGLVLCDGGEILAMTIGSRLSADTVDVHFEKALPGVEGAYAAINRSFAVYIRDKYPSVRFLNREEDMGIEGLRKAKLSYHPHHMVEKEWASLMEEEDED